LRGAMGTTARDRGRFPAAKNLKAVHKTKLYQEITDQIQRLIEGGQLKHGDQLPPERRLAEIFQVSRHSVREAIRTLEEKNVLKSRVGSGTYIIIEDEPLVVDFLARAIHKEKDKLAEIFQFRRMIEPQIAALAAEQASDSDVSQLLDLLERQRRTGTDFRAAIELDQAFHLALARVSKNGILLKVVERLNDILSESRVQISQSQGRLELSVTGHARIIQAVVGGDSEKVAEAMKEHLKQVEEYVLGSQGQVRSGAKGPDTLDPWEKKQT
jgi:GntR family transcriptional repressor for pyruvate dehydrogenase complex